MAGGGLEDVRWQLFAGGIIALHYGRSTSVTATAHPTAHVVTAGLRGALRACEARLSAVVADGITEVAMPGAATLAAGGKRLRPLLVFACAGTDGAPTDAVVRAAAAVELIHMATLVHDDLLDGATMRRGHETVVASHGADAAVQVGDYLFAQAFAELAGAEDPAAIGVLALSALDLSQGELAQGRAAFDVALSERAYLDRVRRKTASLFAAACRLGAMLGGGSAEAQQRLSAFGEAVGMAFQIFDDILDVTGATEVTGKRRGADLRDGTVTLADDLCDPRPNPRWRPRSRASATTGRSTACATGSPASWCRACPGVRARLCQ